MGLAMFLRSGVVELQSPETGTGHEQESDILNILDFLFVGILKYGRFKTYNGFIRPLAFTLKIFKMSGFPTTRLYSISTRVGLVN